MLLILTSSQDLAADFLIVELIRRELAYFRLNVEQMGAAEMTFSLDDSRASREISVEGKTLDLNEVTAVWYRRAIHPHPSAGLTPTEEAFIAGELRHLAMGLILNPAIIWVNPIHSVSVGEHKLYQLQVAMQLGFEVPRTLVSRDPSALSAFVSGNAHGTICKPIYHGLFIDNNARHSVYTRRVDADSFHSDSLTCCPVLLQEEIPRSADVRVTMIGSECFVADITGDSSLVDWRDPDVPVTQSVSTITDETKDRCKSMLHQLNLEYGAFDFIKRPDGDLGWSQTVDATPGAKGEREA